MCVLYIILLILILLLIYCALKWLFNPKSFIQDFIGGYSTHGIGAQNLDGTCTYNSQINIINQSATLRNSIISISRNFNRTYFPAYDYTDTFGTNRTIDDEEMTPSTFIWLSKKYIEYELNYSIIFSDRFKRLFAFVYIGDVIRFQAAYERAKSSVITAYVDWRNAYVQQKLHEGTDKTEAILEREFDNESARNLEAFKQARFSEKYFDHTIDERITIANINDIHNIEDIKVTNPQYASEKVQNYILYYAINNSLAKIRERIMYHIIKKIITLYRFKDLNWDIGAVKRELKIYLEYIHNNFIHAIEENFGTERATPRNGSKEHTELQTLGNHFTPKYYEQLIRTIKNSLTDQEKNYKHYDTIERQFNNTKQMKNIRMDELKRTIPDSNPEDIYKQVKDILNLKDVTFNPITNLYLEYRKFKEDLIIKFLNMYKYSKQSQHDTESQVLNKATELFLSGKYDRLPNITALLDAHMKNLNDSLIPYEDVLTRRVIVPGDKHYVDLATDLIQEIKEDLPIFMAKQDTFIRSLGKDRTATMRNIRVAVRDAQLRANQIVENMINRAPHPMIGHCIEYIRMEAREETKLRNFVYNIALEVPVLKLMIRCGFDASDTELVEKYIKFYNGMVSIDTRPEFLTYARNMHLQSDNPEFYEIKSCFSPQYIIKPVINAFMNTIPYIISSIVPRTYTVIPAVMEHGKYDYSAMNNVSVYFKHSMEMPPSHVENIKNIFKAGMKIDLHKFKQDFIELILTNDLESFGITLPICTMKLLRIIFAYGSNYWIPVGCATKLLLPSYSMQPFQKRVGNHAVYYNNIKSVIYDNSEVHINVHVMNLFPVLLNKEMYQMWKCSGYIVTGIYNIWYLRVPQSEVIELVTKFFAILDISNLSEMEITGVDIPEEFKQQVTGQSARKGLYVDFKYKLIPESAQGDTSKLSEELDMDIKRIENYEQDNLGIDMLPQYGIVPAYRPINYNGLDFDEYIQKLNQKAHQARSANQFLVQPKRGGGNDDLYMTMIPGFRYAKRKVQRVENINTKVEQITAPDEPEIEQERLALSEKLELYSKTITAIPVEYKMNDIINRYLPPEEASGSSSSSSSASESIAQPAAAAAAST